MTRLTGWAATAFVAALALGGCSAIPVPEVPPTATDSSSDAPADTDAASPPSPPFEDVVAGTGLVWSDEFDSVSDSRWSTWKRMEGARGWGNEELQNYTDAEENSFVADGALHIVAKRESTVDADGLASEYTSARLMTYETFRYGRVEARIKIPVGVGLWSAFWLLGTEHTPTAPWPSRGELDVMEYVNQARELNSGIIGVKTDDSPWSWVNAYPVNADWSTAWHVYAVDWTADSVSYSVDGQELGTFRKEDLEPENLWTFDNPSHIILNVAVGGRWPGNDIDDAALPAEYLVDYVRVYDSEIRQVPESWMPKPPW
ncbi:beta-glucanase (GH16 family) [Microbacterium terrae]|uniref:Beta-glucanase n=1 Tax=Microbacterium terrae TaxID=69369 RepID=A0A0M2HER3_9MICO|nr:glycoside hydrolase family 16 protein [Microbacterium terrae]KJL42723.1 Beta-glucanase precursor [Microbacterium terrae]MBP1078564.1 beta-glucanase (GH16 family) [Microbacterium terrae]GLJ97964.1 glycosyl hydrolase family 16 [Microbacterium terrae]